MTLDLRPLSYALGAEVRGVDLAKPVSDVLLAEIGQAFLTHGILLFRGQDITPGQHIAFSRHFGELDRHETLPRDRHVEFPEILMVTNRPKGDGTPSDSRSARRWGRSCTAAISRRSAATPCSPTCTLRTKPCPRP